MRLFIILATALILSVVCVSCNIFNPAETLPTYVHLDSFIYHANTASGTESHKITNVLVYYNNQSVGNFDLPVTFPVIMTKPGTLTLRPGIDVDGLGGYESPYIHYKADTSTLNPDPGGATHNYSPTTAYNYNASINLLESFDNGSNIFRNLNASSAVQFLNTNAKNLAFESGSGLIVLKKGVSDSAVFISGLFPAPYTGLPYLEMNYKSSSPIQVGMSSVASTGDSREYIIGLNAKPNWTKVYIALDYFAQLHNNSAYSLIIRTDRFVEDDVDSAMFDNMKIIYQK